MELASKLSALVQLFGVGYAIKFWFELFNLFQIFHFRQLICFSFVWYCYMSRINSTSTSDYNHRVQLLCLLLESWITRPLNRWASQLREEWTLLKLFLNLQINIQWILFLKLRRFETILLILLRYLWQIYSNSIQYLISNYHPLVLLNCQLVKNHLLIHLLQLLWSENLLRLVLFPIKFCI